MKQRLNTVAVIGAYGFIGKATVKDLLEETDYKVIAISRKKQLGVFEEAQRLVEMQIDYDDKKAVSTVLENVDVVINLAGKMGDSGVTYEMMYRDNVEFVEHILGLCIEAGVNHFIHISTPGVQGLGLKLAKESDPYNPQDDYQKTKMLGEQAVIEKCSNSLMKYTILRPDFVYGVGDERRVKLYRNIKNHRFVLTTNGKACISPTYVSDVAQGIRKALLEEKAFNQVFNISGQEISVKEFLETIAQLQKVSLIHINIGYVMSSALVKMISAVFLMVNRRPIVTNSQIDFLSKNHSTSYCKAEKLIGYKPVETITSGMQRTLEYVL